MDQNDFPEEFDQPFVQHFDSASTEMEDRYKRGKFIVSAMVIFMLISAIVNVVTGGSVFFSAIQIAFFYFLYRGSLIVRILTGLVNLRSAYTYYIVYVYLMAHYGFMVAVFALPFLLISISVPILLFFNRSVDHFLNAQRG